VISMRLMEYLITGTIGIKFLLQLKRNQWRPLKELQTIQLKKLKAILYHAYNYVPYYHRLFKSARFVPEDLKGFKDLQKIPVTTKSDVQNNFSDFMAREMAPSKCVESFTSGTTGIPLKTYKDVRAASVDTALKTYAFLECGMKITDKFVTIAGTPRSLFLPNQTLISWFYENSIILDYLRKINPAVIYACPHIFEDLVTHDTSGINPKLIFSQAENLTQHCRNLIRLTFDLEINDTYGSTEISRLAFECNEHSGLHLITDSGLLEFVDDNNEPVAAGEIGETVVTGLNNYAMPLIRYDLGDLGVYSDERCACGRSWPLIKSIDGRKSDVFITPNGAKIYSHFLKKCVFSEIKKNLFIVSQFQIVQEKRNKIVLKVVKGNKFDANIVDKIKNNIETLCVGFGEDISVETEIVQNISRDKSGKRRTIISMVNNS